jgi:[ribosomal protein S5]-alanine N-acetyltransferase
VADEKVRLRPVEERDLDLLERIDTDPSISEPFEWTGFRNPAERRRRWERDGYLGDLDGLLMVSLLDGVPAGIVIWKVTGGSASHGACYEIGVLLLPEHRGQGLGTAAQVLLCEHLFANTLANRLEALTEVDNVGEQRALTKAGFSREGLLRGRGFLRGAWRDGYIYSRLRHDPPPAPGFTSETRQTP